MESREMEQLWDRYERGETSLEEEARLRACYLEDDDPASASFEHEWFAFLQHECQQGLGSDFDERLLAALEQPVVKARRMSLMARCMPLCKAVAMVSLIVTLGYVAQHSFEADVLEVPAIDTIGKQIKAPSVALSNDGLKAREKQLLDSLKRTLPQK